MINILRILVLACGMHEASFEAGAYLPTYQHMTAFCCQSLSCQTPSRNQRPGLTRGAPPHWICLPGSVFRILLIQSCSKLVSAGKRKQRLGPFHCGCRISLFAIRHNGTWKVDQRNRKSIQFFSGNGKMIAWESYAKERSNGDGFSPQGSIVHV